PGGAPRQAWVRGIPRTIPPSDRGRAPDLRFVVSAGVVHLEPRTGRGDPRRMDAALLPSSLGVHQGIRQILRPGHAVRRRRAADGVCEVSGVAGEVEDARRPYLQEERRARRPAVPTLVAYEIRPVADLGPYEAVRRRRVSDLDRERPVP